MSNYKESCPLENNNSQKLNPQNAVIAMCFQLHSDLRTLYALAHLTDIKVAKQQIEVIEQRLAFTKENLGKKQPKKSAKEKRDQMLIERAKGTLAEGHDPSCRFLISVVGALAIECQHGFDSCPKCDECNCGKGKRKRK